MQVLEGKYGEQETPQKRRRREDNNNENKTLASLYKINKNYKGKIRNKKKIYKKRYPIKLCAKLTA